MKIMPHNQISDISAVFRPGALRGFTVIEPINVAPGMYNASDPLRPDYFRPAYWRILGRNIHASRFLYFSTGEMPVLLRPAYNFFGMPTAQLALDYVAHFTQNRECASRLLNKFSLTAFKTNMSGILQGGAADDLDARLAYFVQKQNNDGCFVLDKETEDLVKLETPLAGVTDIVRQSLEFVAAIFRLPVTKFLGVSPAGFNPTGEADRCNLYDYLQSRQEKILRAPLQRALEVLQMNEFSRVDSRLTFDFVPLNPEDDGGNGGGERNGDRDNSRGTDGPAAALLGADENKFDKDEHPRDNSNGRFIAKGGGGSGQAAGNKEQAEQSAEKTSSTTAKETPGYAPIAGRGKLLVAKLRDNKSYPDGGWPENSVHMNDFTFWYNPADLTRPWSNQTKIDFTDPETVQALLRETRSLTPAHKMLLHHQLMGAIVERKQIPQQQELLEALKPNPPSQWEDEDLALFMEDIKIREGFTGEAKRRLKSDGKTPEDGYTVGYGAFMPDKPGPTGKYTDSPTLEELIKTEKKREDIEGGIRTVEVTEEVAEEILKELINAISKEAEKTLPIIMHLGKVRQRVLLDMIYTMGIRKVKKFKDFLEHLHNNNMAGAGWEMLNSNYRLDVKGRSLYNALTLATGRDDLDVEHYKRLWDEEKWQTKSLDEVKKAFYLELEKLRPGK